MKCKYKITLSYVDAQIPKHPLIIDFDTNTVEIERIDDNTLRVDTAHIVGKKDEIDVSESAIKSVKNATSDSFRTHHHKFIQHEGINIGHISVNNSSSYFKGEVSGRMPYNHYDDNGNLDRKIMRDILPDRNELERRRDESWD